MGLPPPQCYYAGPLDIAVPAARMLNDAIAGIRRPQARPLKRGFATVHMSDGDEAAKVLELNQWRKRITN
jgi:aminocarboxymuconate-semialdehyde decarboxylase